jgi:hypothetical protein
LLSSGDGEQVLYRSLRGRFITTRQMFSQNVRLVLLDLAFAALSSFTSAPSSFSMLHWAGGRSAVGLPHAFSFV